MKKSIIRYMRKNIFVLIYLILSFSLGFLIQKIIDDKKFEQIYIKQANIQTINENLIKENEFLNKLNGRILNQNNLIDKEEKECLLKSLSTVDFLYCIYNAEKKWNAEIIKYLKLLKNVMHYSEYELIEKDYNMWIEQNKKDNAIIDKFIFNHGGTMYQQLGLDKKVELKKQYNELLKEIYNVYTNNITDN